MSPTKMSASFTFLVTSMVAFRLRDGGLGTILAGWGLVQALAQVQYSTQMLGGFQCVPPQGV